MNSDTDTTGPKPRRWFAFLFIWLITGIFSLVCHSFLIGAFVAGPMAALLCVSSGFRKFMLLALLAMVVWVGIGEWQKDRWHHQYPPALPTLSKYGDTEASQRPASFGLRVANQIDVVQYDDYIQEGGDPNQVPILDRIAVALAKHPNMFLDPANRAMFNELVQKGIIRSAR